MEAHKKRMGIGMCTRNVSTSKSGRGVACVSIFAFRPRTVPTLFHVFNTTPYTVQPYPRYVMLEGWMELDMRMLSLLSCSHAHPSHLVPVFSKARFSKHLQTVKSSALSPANQHHTPTQTPTPTRAPTATESDRATHTRTHEHHHLTRLTQSSTLHTP